MAVRLPTATHEYYGSSVSQHAGSPATPLRALTARAPRNHPASRRCGPTPPPSLLEPSSNFSRQSSHPIAAIVSSELCDSPLAQPLLRSLVDAALSGWLDARGTEAQSAPTTQRADPRLAAPFALATNAAELALLPLSLAVDGLASRSASPDSVETRPPDRPLALPPGLPSELPSLGLTTLARHEFYRAWLRGYATESHGALTAAAPIASRSAALKQLLGVRRPTEKRDRIATANCTQAALPSRPTLSCTTEQSD